MKFKKAFAVILAVAMVITLMPSMAFASSTNTVKSVPTVASDDEMPATSINIEVKDSTGWGSESQTVKLNFNNAEWKDTPKISDFSGNTPAVAEEVTLTVNSALAGEEKIILTNALSSGAYTYTQADVVVGTNSTAEQQATVIANDYNGKTDKLYSATVSGAVITFKANTAGTVATDKKMAIGEGTVNSKATLAAKTTGAPASYAATSFGGMTISATQGTSPATVHITDIVSVSDTSIEFTFVGNDLKDGAVITLTFAAGVLKSGNDDGAVTIAIDGLDSYVTSSTLTVATVGSSNTTTTTSGDVKTYSRTETTVNTTIEIRETAVNTITGDQVIKLLLPKGVTWSDITVGGSLATNGDAMVTEVDSVSKVNSFGQYCYSNDDRAVYIYLDVNPENSVRQVATITSKITIGKSASEGDIAVELTGYRAVSGNGISDASNLIIAKYGDEDVSVYTVGETDIPTIYSGYVTDKKDKNTYIQVTFKESIKGSLESGRYIDFELPEGVVVKTDLTNTSSTSTSGTHNITTPYNIKYSLDKNADLDDASSAATLSTSLIEFESDSNGSEFSFMIPENGNSLGSANWDSTKANTLTLFIPVTIRADVTGDVEVKVTGAKAGIADTTLVVAKAESPIKVETTTTEVKNGVQSQSLADITITENVAGYLKENEDVTLSIDNLGLTTGFSFTDATVAVTDGDLEIKNFTKSSGNLKFDVKSESTKASTIKITGVVAALNRTLPEGPYALDVYGDALIDNNRYNDMDFDTKESDIYAAVVKDYVKIITPADSTTIATKIDAQFVIGQASYTNNGTAVTMDAAPYIDSHNRTMVPIRYIAEACGIAEADITWNQATQTAIINGANTVISITMGSNVITTSTGTITMDTVAVNNNGRIYVPARFIANALGAQVTWDNATRTVGLTN